MFSRLIALGCILNGVGKFIYSLFGWLLLVIFFILYIYIYMSTILN